MSLLSFPFRVTMGLTFFAILAYCDYRKHPENPTRIREYSFLAAVTFVAMAYGLAHDVVTCSISPQYFVLGKGIQSAVDGFNREVAILALKATWTPGLLEGALLLFANNPGRARRQLPYKRLFRLAAIPLLCSICLELLLGAFAWQWPETAVRLVHLEALLTLVPRDFIVVWAMHWGAYAGFAFGLTLAIFLVIRYKRGLPNPLDNIAPSLGA